MRSLILLCVLGLGVFLPTTYGQGSCNKVKLNYRNYGESWFVDVEGPLVGKNALKYSEAGELMLDNTVHWYDILFTEGTSVNRVKAKFKNTDNVTMEVFQEGSSSVAKTVTKNTGGSDWKLKRNPFIVNLQNVRKIQFTWTANAQLTGIMGLVVVACEAGSCIKDQQYNTTKSLDLPSGFNISVPGPALVGTLLGFSVDPRAVLAGSKKTIQLRDITAGTNFISMTFDSAVKIRTFHILLNHAEGLVVKCYSDPNGSQLIYTGTESFDEKWAEVKKSALIGPISNIRRVDLHMVFDLSSSDRLVHAKKLTFFTCQ